MQIGGLQKFSALDYPGKMSCIVFCRGCPLRCHYCHNQDLQKFDGLCEINDKDLYDFLKERVGLLDAVVFSGGEPLYQSDLKDKLFHVKQFGFLTGLHTSGYKPDALEDVLELIDWVGLDIKTTFHKYEQVTQIKNSGEKALQSFQILQSKNVNFEVRTTYDNRYMCNEDLIELANFLKNHGVHRWVIQQCILRNNSGESQKLPLPDLGVISDIIEVEIRK